MTNEGRDLKRSLQLEGTVGAALRLRGVQKIIARAKFTSGISHYLAIELLEHAVGKFDEQSAPHLNAVRDFFGEFWQEIEKKADEVAWHANRNAEASSAASRAFTILSDKTKGLVRELADATKTPTMAEFGAKLGELKLQFRETPSMLKIWREVLDEKFGKLP